MFKTPAGGMFTPITLALVLTAVALPQLTVADTVSASAQQPEGETPTDTADKVYLVAWKHEFHQVQQASVALDSESGRDGSESTTEVTTEYSGTATIRISPSTLEKKIDEMSTTARHTANHTTSWRRNPDAYCPPSWGQSRTSTRRVEIVDPNEHANGIEPGLLNLRFDGPTRIASYPVGAEGTPGHDPRLWTHRITDTGQVQLCDGGTKATNDTWEMRTRVTDPWTLLHPSVRVPEGTFGDLVQRPDGAFEFNGTPPSVVMDHCASCAPGMTNVETRTFKTHITVTPKFDKKLSVGDSTVNETDSGTTPAEFVISLSTGSSEPVTVKYSTIDDTANAPADYESASGTVTFEPGATRATVSIPIIGETDDEQEEAFVLKLSNPTNASIEDGEGLGVISDNDVWAKVWLSAFIPGGIPGLTMTVPGGPYAGQTMINGPLPISDCFLTDQRGYANDPTASHRIQSFLIVDPKKQRIVEQRHHSDATIEVDCEDGTVECTRTAQPAADVSLVQATEDQAVFDLSAGASNGCFRGAPDIDYNGTLVVEHSAGVITVRFTGRVEVFPDLEMYAAAFHEQAGGPVFLQSHSGRPRDMFGQPRVFVWGETMVAES